MRIIFISYNLTSLKYFRNVNIGRFLSKNLFQQHIPQRNQKENRLYEKTLYHYIKSSYVSLILGVS